MLKRFGWGLHPWLGLFLQSVCPLCQRATVQRLCPTCGQKLADCKIAQPVWTQPTILPLLAWGQYEGTLKRAIAAFKYDKHRHLAQPLGHRMAETWKQANGNRVNGNQKGSFPTRYTVVPIPMHPSKQQQRGFNQAELLARHFCDLTRFSLEIHGLQRVRETEAQFSLSPTQRRQNLDHAFSLGPKFLKHPPATPVLLLDDIYTTGATALSATQVLQQQGIRVEGIVVLAKTGR